MIYIQVVDKLLARAITWGDVILSIFSLTKCLLHLTIKFPTPFYFQRNHSFISLHMFLVVYVLFMICLQVLDKLSAKAIKCVFLVYSRLQKEYQCYSLETKYYMSTNVTFLVSTPFFPPSA